MSFDTLGFWTLFAVVLIGFQVISISKRPAYLLIVSYLYYATWDVRFLFLLLVSTLVDYSAAFYVSKDRPNHVRKLAVGLSLLANLSLLGYFKYYWSWANLYEIGIPVGISFYTFQSISYTIDVYRGRIKPYSHFLHVALFVSFFPQLAAGPIERARNLLPQMVEFSDLKKENLAAGFWLILLGLFKKVYVAEGLRYPIEAIFNSSNAPGGTVIAACLLMVFQVYADFSGYSDMARGMARMLGVHLMINFKPFYFATSPSDFWQRWHISLTTWIRDYAILPLKRAAKSNLSYQTYVLLTFLLFGLWHDANWTWILFGLLHGLAVLLERMVKAFPQLRSLPKTLTSTIGISFMLAIYFFSGLLHQSRDLGHARALLGQISRQFFFTAELRDLLIYSSFFLIPLFMYEFLQERSGNYDWIERRGLVTKILFLVFCLSGIIIFERATKIGFIYFHF